MSKHISYMASMCEIIPFLRGVQDRDNCLYIIFSLVCIENCPHSSSKHHQHKYMKTLL